MKSKNPERIHPQEQMLNRKNIEQQRLKEKQTDKIVGKGLVKVDLQVSSRNKGWIFFPEHNKHLY